MTDAIEPTPETEENDVEGHSANPLSLQELEGKDGFTSEPVMGDGSTVSLAACA